MRNEAFRTKKYQIQMEMIGSLMSKSSLNQYKSLIEETKEAIQKESKESQESSFNSLYRMNLFDNSELIKIHVKQTESAIPSYTTADEKSKQILTDIIKVSMLFDAYESGEISELFKEDNLSETLNEMFSNKEWLEKSIQNFNFMSVPLAIKH